MARRVGLPPRVRQLRAFDVNRRGMVEAIRQSQYDFQTYPAAGTTQLIFFQVPQGQGGKTKDDTNLEIAGSLPRPKEFLIESIEIYFFPGVDIAQIGAPSVAASWANDVQAIGEAGFGDLFIGSKSYLTEAPVQRFAPKTRLYAEAAASDSTTLGAAQNVRFDYAVWAGRPYYLDPEIRLIHTQNFNFTINFAAAVPTPSTQDARIGVVLDGILYRLSQ